VAVIYVSILATLIRRLEHSSATGFWNGEYKGFVEGLGKEAVTTKILGSVNGDIVSLMDTTKFDLATIRLCDTRTARTLHKPGVYVHAMYHPANPKVVAIYIGSAMVVSSRIDKHHCWLRKWKINRSIEKLGGARTNKLSITSNFGLAKAFAISG